MSLKESQLTFKFTSNVLFLKFEKHIFEWGMIVTLVRLC